MKLIKIIIILQTLCFCDCSKNDDNISQQENKFQIETMNKPYNGNVQNQKDYSIEWINRYSSVEYSINSFEMNMKKLSYRRELHDFFTLDISNFDISEINENVYKGYLDSGAFRTINEKSNEAEKKKLQRCYMVQYFEVIIPETCYTIKTKVIDGVIFKDREKPAYIYFVSPRSHSESVYLDINLNYDNLYSNIPLNNDNGFFISEMNIIENKLSLKYIYPYTSDKYTRFVSVQKKYDDFPEMTVCVFIFDSKEVSLQYMIGLETELRKYYVQHI